MNNIFKRLIIVLLISFMSIINFTGCKDTIEIEKLAIILAIGFDLDSNNNYEVSIEITDSNTLTSQNKKTVSYCAKGETVFKAIDNIYKNIGQRFNYSHIQYIVIGDNVARKGIASIIDFSLRYNQIRPNIPFLVTKEKARDIVEAKISTNTIPSMSITDLLNLQKDRGETVFTTNLDFVNSIAHGSKSTTCGLINIDRHKLDKNINYSLSGAAVFKKDKLVGYLSTRETVGLNWIRGDINRYIVMIEYPKDYKISLDVTESSEKTNLYIDKDNKVNIILNVKLKSSIREMTGMINPNKNPSIMDLLSEKQNEVIYQDVSLVINKAQKNLNIDIFDFGNIMMKKYPNQWDYMEKDWNNTFKNINIDINIDSRVNKTGVLSKPPI